ncbi:hypothetical protein IQ07DRAFT_650245 [Pyrenochaeta sp. DS3sAY3a]|nr:hypothetical protein IQ07DRAFT_650245 [Pyrenochaeta sp. DS3sAY3a]
MSRLNLSVLELLLLLSLELHFLILILVVVFKHSSGTLRSLVYYIMTSESTLHPPVPAKKSEGTRQHYIENSEPQLLPISYAYTADMLIRVPTGEYTIAAVALDTQCQLGNWISERLVEELGMLDLICKDSCPAQVVTASGQEIESTGTIDLVWKLAPNESRVFRSRFFTLGGARHLDVILGQDTITKEGFLSLNMRKLLAPFTSHKPITKEEKAIIKAQEARQEQEKKELEARRLAAQQAQAAEQQQ